MVQRARAEGRRKCREPRYAGVAELVDAKDLKSFVPRNGTCRFNSGPRHMVEFRALSSVPIRPNLSIPMESEEDKFTLELRIPIPLDWIGIGSDTQLRSEEDSRLLAEGILEGS